MLSGFFYAQIYCADLSLLAGALINLAKGVYMQHSIKKQFDNLRAERDSAVAHAELLSLELAKILESNKLLPDRQKRKLHKLLHSRSDAGNILYIRTLASLEQYMRESLLHDISNFRDALSKRLNERNHRLLRLNKERVTSRYCN